MPATFTLHEPSPHLPAKLPFGRGGAGNRTSTTSSTKANPAISARLPQPPSSISSAATSQTNSFAALHSHATNKPFHTGRGGAGNLRPQEDERRLFSFDEELEREDLKWRSVRGSSFAEPGHSYGRNGRQADGGRVPVYHIGRGGSGNAVAANPSGSTAELRRGSDSSGSDGSSATRKGVSGWVKGLGRRA